MVMGVAAATGIPPRDLLGLDWLELITLVDVLAEQNKGR